MQGQDASPRRRRKHAGAEQHCIRMAGKQAGAFELHASMRACTGIAHGFEPAAPAAAAIPKPRLRLYVRPAHLSDCHLPGADLAIDALQGGAAQDWGGYERCGRCLQVERRGRASRLSCGTATAHFARTCTHARAHTRTLARSTIHPGLILTPPPQKPAHLLQVSYAARQLKRRPLVVRRQQVRRGARQLQQLLDGVEVILNQGDVPQAVQVVKAQRRALGGGWGEGIARHE
jgi:hypothetical protein